MKTSRIPPAGGGAGHASARRVLSRLAATLLALLAAAGLGGWPAAPAQGRTNDDSARYTVTFQGEWTLGATPGGVVPGAHFTTLVGAVHNGAVTLWSPGGTASPGIEDVAELGATSRLQSEIRARGSDVASVILKSPGFGGRGSATFDVEATTAHPLLTLVSMIGPSPDWFVGVSGLSLLDAGGRWRSRQSVDLFPYDAGTEDGEEFSLGNPATSPRGVITSIRGTGKFSSRPMATLSFVRKDTPPAPPAPTVSSITRRMPVTARARDDALVWQVVFSEAVTGVDAADFDIAGTTAQATAVKGGGATWWVTVSGGDLGHLDGEVSLRLAGDQDIENSAGRRLDPALPTGAGYQTFTLDNTAPGVTIGPSSAGGSPFRASIRSSEPVTGLTLSDIIVTNGSATDLRGGNGAYTVLLTPASADAPATITVTVAPGAVRDLAGNGNPVATRSIEYVPDTSPPPRGIAVTVADARASEGDPVTFTVRLTGGTPDRGLQLVATPASGPDDTATADTDYETAVRDVSIAAGRTSATLAVATTRDGDDEADETFTVTLSARPGATLPAGVEITHGTATGTIVDGGPASAAHHVPMFLSASDPLGRRSFARIVNHSNEAGEVRIDAFDDEGSAYGPSTLAIGANETVHINSGDLETGNAAKGLDGATGPGRGHWRLELFSGLDVEVLAYLRTDDGFVTSMHDVVPRTGAGRHVAIFNPGGNTSQVSRLRLINRGAETAEVSIVGIDGRGESPGTAVRLPVPARGARTVTARELESEEGRGRALRDLVGALGDGAGKWRLVVTSDRPVQVMSLLASPTGHLTNLSTAPDRTGPARAR